MWRACSRVATAGIACRRRPHLPVALAHGVAAERPDDAVNVSQLAQEHFCTKTTLEKRKAILERSKAENRNEDDLAVDLLRVRDTTLQLSDILRVKELFKRELLAKEGHLNEDNAQLAETLCKVADVEFLLGEHNEALELFKRALALIIDEICYGNSSALASGTLYKLATVIVEQERADEAKRLLPAIMAVGNGRTAAR